MEELWAPKPLFGGKPSVTQEQQQWIIMLSEKQTYVQVMTLGF